MRHAAHVAHHTRGRLRIRVPSAKGHAAALEMIKQSLAKVHGVTEVLVNDAIGSITIHYDPQHHGEIEKRLASDSSHQDVVSVQPPPKLEDLEELDKMLAHEAEFLAEHSDSAKVIFDFINGLDQSVKRYTNNAVDFMVIAPLAVAVGAFLELGITASTPVWLTLGLFSFNHFISLHSRANTGDAACPVPGAECETPPAASVSKKQLH
jgi:hypothetical protein